MMLVHPLFATAACSSAVVAAGQSPGAVKAVPANMSGIAAAAMRAVAHVKRRITRLACSLISWFSFRHRWRERREEDECGGNGAPLPAGLLTGPAPAMKA